MKLNLLFLTLVFIIVSCDTDESQDTIITDDVIVTVDDGNDNDDDGQELSDDVISDQTPLMPNFYGYVYDQNNIYEYINDSGSAELEVFDFNLMSPYTFNGIGVFISKFNFGASQNLSDEYWLKEHNSTSGEILNVSNESTDGPPYFVGASSNQIIGGYDFEFTAIRTIDVLTGEDKLIVSNENPEGLANSRNFNDKYFIRQFSATDLEISTFLIFDIENGEYIGKVELPFERMVSRDERLIINEDKFYAVRNNGQIFEIDIPSLSFTAFAQPGGGNFYKVDEHFIHFLRENGGNNYPSMVRVNLTNGNVTAVDTTPALQDHFLSALYDPFSSLRGAVYSGSQNVWIFWARPAIIGDGSMEEFLKISLDGVEYGSVEVNEEFIGSEFLYTD